MNTLTDIRDDYIRLYRPRARAEAAYFARGSALERVRKAAGAHTECGGKHKHQWRIPPALLAKFSERLIARLEEVTSAPSFADLLATVEAAKLKGVGELAVYDTAVRIGAGQQLEPNEVYLHAGTRKGAALLGLKVNRASIPKSEIPKELEGLTPSEVEDLLCTYAGYFGKDAKKSLPTDCGGNRRRGCRPEVNNSRGCA